MKRLLLLAVLTFSGCAAVPQKTTLTDLKTGEVLNGGFALVTRNAWVDLPDGTRLSGKISLGRATTSGTATVTTFTPKPSTSMVHFDVALAERQGWTLLKSADGKKTMWVKVSAQTPTSGYGTAVMDDREFTVSW